MRERFFDTINNIFISPKDIAIVDDKMFIIDLNYKLTDEISYNRVIRSRFTGLKDRNGKDIYECDIVKIINSSYGTYLSTIRYENSLAGFIVGQAYGIAENKQIEMPDREWDMKHMPCNCDGAMYNGYIVLHVENCLTELNEKIEVVGNIYENKDLLQ